MAAGKHRSRIGFLTLARIFAASVVALAFAATIVVVVFTAGLAPDRVRLSVTHGHIQSAGLLWYRKNLQFPHLRLHRDYSVIVYAPAEKLTVWVSMDAHDPTRRAANVCVESLHVLDMPNAPSFDGMVEIATVYKTVATGSDRQPCAPWRHNGSATMQLDRWITLATTSWNPVTLCYISHKYGGVNDFTAMLKVHMRILYPPKGEGDRDSPEDHNDTHFCWPVTIGNSRNTRSQAVTCKPSHAIDYASDAPVLSASNLTAYQQRICRQYGENFSNVVFER